MIKSKRAKIWFLITSISWGGFCYYSIEPFTKLFIWWVDLICIGEPFCGGHSVSVVYIDICVLFLVGLLMIYIMYLNILEDKEVLK